MASRSLDDLEPAFKAKAYAFQMRCEEVGFNVLIYCTLRSPDEQSRLYRQGRPLGEIRAKAQELRDEYSRPDLADLLMAVGPQYGRKVTNAGPGQSLHNYGLAFDGVPLVHGKPAWESVQPSDLTRWQRYGELAESVVLEWSGRWESFREMPHCQEPTASWRAMIRQDIPTLT